MGKYSVKEVCEITGLTRKDLYNYKCSIKPAGYENKVLNRYGEQIDGYKYYDEDGLEMLRDAALLKSLGLKPKEINEVFLSGGGNIEEVIERIIQDAKKSRERLDDIIDVAEGLKKNSN
ncbi:MAG: hypothetical protein PUD72_03665 [Oscillospiraceae bacterium]|nr:hypothetical protein [Oscillospiraceae bacterium]